MFGNAIIDLTHSLSGSTPVFPGDDPVKITVVEQAGVPHASGRRGLNCSRLEMSVHSGTHMDAPFHFFNNGATIDDVPLSTCVGEAILIDLRPLDPRTELRKAHVEKFQEAVGEVKRVVFLTGWSNEWSRPTYFTDYPVSKRPTR